MNSDHQRITLSTPPPRISEQPKKTMRKAGEDATIATNRPRCKAIEKTIVYSSKPANMSVMPAAFRILASSRRVMKRPTLDMMSVQYSDQFLVSSPSKYHQSHVCAYFHHIHKPTSCPSPPQKHILQLRKNQRKNTRHSSAHLLERISTKQVYKWIQSHCRIIILSAQEYSPDVNSHYES